MNFGITPHLLALLQASGGGGLLPQFVFQFGLIFLIIWFLIIRPQQKQRKQHEEALRNLKRGERVVTAGGIIGDVIHIRETTKDGKAAPSMDDEVTIKSGESRMIVERGKIARIQTQSAPAASA